MDGSGYDEADAAFDEGREEGFREGMAAASCACPHLDTCPRSENYRPPFGRRLVEAFRRVTS